MSIIKNLQKIFNTASFTAVLFFGLFIAVCLSILINAVSYVLPNLSKYTGVLYIITPWIIPIATLEGPILMLYYIFLVFAIVFSFIFLFLKDGKEFTNELLGAVRERKIMNMFSKNAFVLLPTIFFSVLFFDAIYSFILTLFGITPSTPNFGEKPKWELLYSFANASVYEEIVSRILLIGAPLFIIEFGEEKNLVESGLSGFFRNKKRYIIGGDFSMNKKTIALIIFSSIVFGFAHSFGGWDFYKVIPTFIAGIAFAYLFLVKGLYAAIILHFSFDYSSFPSEFFPNIESFYFLIILLWLCIGAVYFIYYCAISGKFLLGSIKNIYYEQMS